MKRTYKSRKWLNSGKSETAFISVEYENDPEPKLVKFKWKWASVKIADCDRMINLDFDYRTTKEAKARLKKLDILIEELEKLRACIEVDVEE